jgi:protein translocase SecG subunit
MPAWINTAIPIVQIVLSAILVGLILLQAKGTGLATVFGGEGNVYSTRRGAERIIFYATIVVAVLFFAVALFNVTR